LDKSKSKLINQDQYNLNVFKPYYFYETVLTYRPYLAEYFLKNHFFKKAQIKGLFLKPKLLKRLAFYNTFESDDHKE